jgi:hypothetical protein
MNIFCIEMEGLHTQTKGGKRRSKDGHQNLIVDGFTRNGIERKIIIFH